MANTGSWPQAPGQEILPRDFIGQNNLHESLENMHVKE